MLYVHPTASDLVQTRDALNTLLGPELGEGL
jgi:hypothetical protein